MSKGANGAVNDDIVIDGVSVSDDGSRVVFSSWSPNGLDVPYARSACSFDWIYLRDLTAQTTRIAVYGWDQKPLCAYDSNPKISGDGSFVAFYGGYKRFSTRTQATTGHWRTALGSVGFELINARGIQFSPENEGSLTIGTALVGQGGASALDTDGNSIPFTMRYLENSPDVARQYNATLFANAMKRADQGAQIVSNQDVTLDHSVLDNTFDVDASGSFVVYSEKLGGVRRYKVWDMLARADRGLLFQDVVAKQPTAAFTVCGLSDKARYLLVSGDFKVPLNPAAPALGYQKMYQQLARYDTLEKTFTFVAVSEEQSRSTGASCEYWFGGGLVRQMSKDGNRVAWQAAGYFFVRDIATQKTLKIVAPGTIVEWTLSGDGRHIVYHSDIAPDGKVYKSATGGTRTQIYRFGPIAAGDFGSSFTLDAFEAKLLGK